MIGRPSTFHSFSLKLPVPDSYHLDVLSARRADMLLIQTHLFVQPLLRDHPLRDGLNDKRLKACALASSAKSGATDETTVLDKETPLQFRRFGNADPPGLGNRWGFDGFE